MADDAVIKVRDLVVGFGQQIVLDHLSLDVRGGDISFAGQRGTLNSLVVDGANNDNTFFGQTVGRTGSGRAPYQFSQDAVKEFQVNANAYSAEYGRAGGAVHNAAVACWGVKRKYDSVRPISQIRSQPALERRQGTHPIRELDHDAPHRGRHMGPGDAPPLEREEATQDHERHEREVHEDDRLRENPIHHVRVGSASDATMPPRGRSSSLLKGHHQELGRPPPRDLFGWS